MLPLPPRRYSERHVITVHIHDLPAVKAIPELQKLIGVTHRPKLERDGEMSLPMPEIKIYLDFTDITIEHLIS